MPVARTRSVLSGMRVKEAMRRQIISLDGTASIWTGIGRLIKYKADALLVMDAEGKPAGIVSKTDMAAAYYAGMPSETPLEAVMAGPLHTCFIDDGLEHALDRMSSNGIHQLFVVGADAGRFEGMLNYGDILGLVFQICRNCRKNRLRQSAAGVGDHHSSESTISEVMTSAVLTCKVTDDLYEVMDSLSACRMSAILVTGESGRPAGVISKTNLIVAWHRGVSPDAEAAAVMSKPVISCDRNETINQALARMLLGDMGRIFVHAGDPGTIVGVLSLSDAANHRSGTCRACVSSRMVN
ncbi:CBS domain-containing protein [uncultured Desulfosarcina sp.]|uniref:CBS domain-containing protein n=1 Tax=uncultured Desulfosarcina sp. TaxID=218289 RepID=UPI0029C87197|nr:CBS domain-containing protein [uncultured Desulfosarcina sp.]